MFCGCASQTGISTGCSGLQDSTSTFYIFSVGCVGDHLRQIAFRNRLRANADDRLLYESVKRRLAKEDWMDMNAYARAKTEVVEQITARALQEADNAV